MICLVIKAHYEFQIKDDATKQVYLSDYGLLNVILVNSTAIHVQLINVVVTIIIPMVMVVMVTIVIRLKVITIITDEYCWQQLSEKIYVGKNYKTR